MLACDDATPPAPAVVSAVPSASVAPAPPTRSLAEARARMEMLLTPGHDVAALTPKPGDAKAVFTSPLAEAAEAHYAKLALPIAKEQSELLMWKVPSEDLRKGTGDAVKCDPRFRELGAEVKPGHTWYCARFVEPAKKEGTTADALVFVNGHWALFLAPWDIPR